MGLIGYAVKKAIKVSAANSVIRATGEAIANAKSANGVNGNTVVIQENINMIKPTNDSAYFVGLQCDEAERLLRKAGFFNIERVAKYDLINGWLTKENSVESISINGLKDFRKKDKFYSNADICIIYHAKKNSGGRSQSYTPMESIGNYCGEYKQVTYESVVIDDRVNIPFDLKYFYGQNCYEIEKEFHEIGFKNIQLVEVYELEPEEVEKEFKIKDIQIGGKSVIDKKEKFRKDIVIKIFYYTIKNNTKNGNSAFNENVQVQGMFCSNCGNRQTNHNAKFCKYCGVKL